MHRDLLCVGRQLAPALGLLQRRARRAAEVRHIGHDLQRVAMSADPVVVELGLHGCLIDEILRRTATDHDRGGARAADDQVGGFDDIANHVHMTGSRIGMTRLRQTHANGGVGDARTEDRNCSPVGCGQDPVLSGRFPKVTAEQVEKLT